MDDVKRLAIFDDDELSGAMLPVRANLRKGAPKGTDGKTIGKDLSYFRFDTKDKALEAKFNKIYEKQIKEFGGAREIEFIVYGSTVEDVYRPCKELRTKNKLIHRCNGRECYLWRKEDGTYSTEIIPCPGGCKYKIKMPILMTDLKEAIAVNVHSTSFWDSLTLWQNLKAIEVMFGTLMGIKMILRRELKAIQKPVVKNGQRTGETFLSEDWLLTITAHPDAFAKRLLQLQDSVGKSLPPAQLAIGDGGFQNPEQWSDDEDDEGEALCSPDLQNAIRGLWPIVGYPRKGEKMPQPLNEFLKKNKGVDSIQELDQQSGENLLRLLQERELEYDANKEAQAQAQSAMDYICGNDLAERIINGQARIKQLGWSDDDIRTEWEAHAGDGIYLETCDKATAEGWLDILSQTISSLESKR